MATATRKYPIGWTVPTVAPEGQGFMCVLTAAMNQAFPVQAVLVREDPAPVFMVLGTDIVTTVEPCRGLFRSRMFTYPAGREQLDAELRAQGFRDLETGGA